MTGPWDKSYLHPITSRQHSRSQRQRQPHANLRQPTQRASAQPSHGSNAAGKTGRTATATSTRREGEDARRTAAGRNSTSARREGRTSSTMRPILFLLAVAAVLTATAQDYQDYAEGYEESNMYEDYAANQQKKMAGGGGG